MKYLVLIKLMLDIISLLCALTARIRRKPNRIHVINKLNSGMEDSLENPVSDAD